MRLIRVFQTKLISARNPTINLMIAYRSLVNAPLMEITQMEGFKYDKSTKPYNSIIFTACYATNRSVLFFQTVHKFRTVELMKLQY